MALLAYCQIVNGINLRLMILALTQVQIALYVICTYGYWQTTTTAAVAVLAVTAAIVTFTAATAAVAGLAGTPDQSYHK